ncbi:NAD(P)/FAD-dependent oxidoreductase [Cellulomonas carbonis]|uniref:NAD(P)/FAD-dependent oxidoreductase n=1 Tax=Cellulomonas carbonis TaxID=1386092 RepID=UPI0009E0009F|nr:FAD-binding oxidoreductase [Cellulomonas carbonis]
MTDRRPGPGGPAPDGADARDARDAPAARPYRDVSLWLDQVADDGDRLEPRPGLDRATDADVVVVGGGLTGLWTAYYLTAADPTLDVLVVEQEVVGFGASGRNGGWCSALFPTSAAGLARRHGTPAALAMRAAMRATLDEVERVVAVEDLRCDLVRGGTVTLARTTPQLARARAEAAEAERWGDRLDLLGAEDARRRLAGRGTLGGTWTPDCLRVQPARLVRGLARVVERRGARVAERTRAVEVAPGRVVVEHAGRRADVRARWVVRATEAWTARLPGTRRAVAPVYSLMVATEPLPEDVWEGIGLAEAETFSDHRHLVVYGQRTADGRLAFGGRGAPYHWGSAIRPGSDREPTVFAALERTLRDLLPQLGAARVTHRWGGPLGIARDWHASVGADPRGLAWAGGYVGDGVATTNLAGRTLADLVTGRDTALTRLPWVGHRSRPWEPEPLRWLGINAGLRAAALADVEERLTDRPSAVARVMAPLTGH